MKLTNLKIPFILTLFSLSLTSAAYSKTPLLEEANKLRQQGTSGLQTFLHKYSQELSAPTAEMKTALDQLCQQKDCHASKLFWYTDLEQAKAAAKASGKPILSLHLLGELDTDLSCANSRFFRVALYPNQEISQVLRDKYILHWQSVRPVPQVTIDFGDGRKLQRTITGNSIHYILDSAGRPVDAIPGLYGPRAFLQQIQRAEVAANKFSKLQGISQEAFLREYHSQRLTEMETEWTRTLSRLRIPSPPRLVELSGSTSAPDAEIAAPLAIGKAMVEAPVLTSIRPGRRVEVLDEATWNRIASLYHSNARLDQNSIALIQSKNFQAAKDANGLSNVVRSFERSMAVDTVRNEFMLHRQIHQWFVDGNETQNVNVLNEKVYAELFLTPSSDPWLGLAPKDAYSGIDNDGIVNSSSSFRQ
ncbi:MAG TPA: hypothetical protein VK184_10720 [Nostocaceae cyanobacterium]|nr:hypothetical protein [Nostocaceae cyanobacterium]